VTELGNTFDEKTALKSNAHGKNGETQNIDWAFGDVGFRSPLFQRIQNERFQENESN
jgi:hypothetical protein